MIKYLGGHIIGFLLLLMLALTPKPAQAQADTSQFVETDGLGASPLKEKTWAPNPQKAVYLALIPGLGLGQWYNHKYWKTPIVYIGYASLIYGIIYTSGKYHDYKRAYVSIADGDANSNYWTKFIPNGQDETSVDTGWLTQALQSRYIRFRRYRDYCILGTVAFYGLTILDAYVDAQLFDFDIAPNLSLHLQPQFDLLSANPQSTLGMQCTLTF
ncbi:MAG: hypothetical protein IJR32_03920 [Paludibacteraceae bacterium]|nr:hypothetical protein [Paludibacteraceae bacterium]